jgi:hypothetical protein
MSDQYGHDANSRVSAAMSIHDLWINAFAAFPDLQRLARLLRCENIPMTQGARNTLAELLSPGDPPIDSFVLELKPNADFDKMLRKFDAVADYKMGISADEAGAKQNVTGRTVFRYLDEEIPQKLGQRLRGKDDPKRH